MIKNNNIGYLQPLLVSILLTASISACSNASKTATDAPNSTANTGGTQTTEDTKVKQDDAQSDIRKKQIESDIRAREQRNNALGDPQKRDDSDLASQVRGKLEANIPKGKLTVEAKDAAVTVSGSVTSQDQLNKIEPLARQIKGVKNVLVRAVVSQPQ